MVSRMKYKMMCKGCGEVEIEHPMTEEHPLKHICGQPMQRIYGRVGLKFVGSGFFSTDSILQDPDPDDIIDAKVDRRSKGLAE